MRQLLQNGSPRQTIVKNTFWLFAAQGLNRVLRFGVIFVAARFLGPDGYGSFAYALSAATMAFVLADWGVDLLVVREFNRRTDRDAFLRSALGLKAALLGLFGAIGAVGYWVIDEPGAKSVYLLLVLLMVLQQFRDFFIYLLRARELMEREFAVIAVESVATLGAVALLLWAMPGVVSLGVAYLVGMALSLIMGAWLARDTYARPLVGWDSGIVRWLLRHGWSLAVFGVLVSLFFSTDQIMLGRWRAPAEVGLYAVAAKVVTLALVIPQVALTALFPYLIRVAGSRRSRDVAIAMTAILALLGLVVAGITWLFAPWIVLALGGAEYATAVPILRNLIWVVAMIFPVTFLDYFLIANGRQVADLVATGIAAAVNVALNVALVPAYGVSGAVWATMIGQGANTLLTAVVAAGVFLGGGIGDEGLPVTREEPPTI